MLRHACAVGRILRAEDPSDIALLLLLPVDFRAGNRIGVPTIVSFSSPPSSFPFGYLGSFRKSVTGELASSIRRRTEPTNVRHYRHIGQLRVGADRPTHSSSVQNKRNPHVVIHLAWIWLALAGDIALHAIQMNTAKQGINADFP